jgi:hypothetical protein
MSVIRSDGSLRDEVEQDVTQAFATAFPGTFDIVEPFKHMPAIETDHVTVVPWVWNGVHEGTFFDARATGNPVEITGVTMVTDQDGKATFHRIVDWHTLYRQIGFLMVCRRPRSPDTESADLIDIPGASS